MSLLKKYLKIIVFLFLTACVSAQNLVKNPSFEVFVNCPERLGNFSSDVVSWSIPTEGSTDYFNACSKVMGTPENFKGSQPVNFGKGYAGLYLYAPNDYREYLQVGLVSTLEKGKKYQISFYVSLAERSDFAVKEFGILFSNKMLKLKGKKEISKKKRYEIQSNRYNYLEIGYSNFYSDTHDWILVNAQFVANGTENYIILGNFNTNARTRMFKIKKEEKQGAYYYVDMFKVQKIVEKNDKQVNNENVDSLKLGASYVFKNMVFEFDKFSIAASAKKELQQLVQYVKANTSLQITIHGHTDTIGDEIYNLKLAKNRARIVAEYLQSLGLSETQIIWRGWGGKKPIANNSTKGGRQQNRRVEFVITKKGPENR